MASIERFADFDTNMVLAAGFAPLSQLFKGPISAIFRADIAIATIALIQHEAIEAIFIAAGVCGTDAF